MRLGDLDALKDEMSKVFFNDNDDMRRIEELIDNAPTVEYTFEEAFQKTVCENRLYCPARPQGKWIFNTEMSVTCSLWNCSVCNRLNGNNSFNFCPNCGAKMQKGGKEE